MITAIGECIGPVIKIDYQTECGRRGRFARMAISLDLRQPLVSKLLINGRLQVVEYESLPTICFECGKYDHVKDICPSLSRAASSPPVATPPAPIAPPSTEAFGPWMLVERRQRRNIHKAANHTSPPVSSPRSAVVQGSRFNPIFEENIGTAPTSADANSQAVTAVTTIGVDVPSDPMVTPVATSSPLVVRNVVVTPPSSKPPIPQSRGKESAKLLKSSAKPGDQAKHLALPLRKSVSVQRPSIASTSKSTTLTSRRNSTLSSARFALFPRSTSKFNKANHTAVIVDENADPNVNAPAPSVQADPKGDRLLDDVLRDKMLCNNYWDESFPEAAAKQRKVRNRITSLQLPDGSWCDDENILRSEAANFFRDLFLDHGHASSTPFPFSRCFPVMPQNVLDSLATAPPFSERDAICAALGFSLTLTLGKYLGVPVIHQRMKAADFDFLMSKLRTKLNGWAAGSSRKISLVNWSTIAQPCNRGGLGIPRCYERNLAFMQKLAFQLVSSTESMWVTALRQKYRMLTTCPLSIARQNCSPLWRALANIWDSFRDDSFRDNTFWLVGDATDVHLWNDTWVPSVGPLRPWLSNALPSVYQLHFEDMLHADGNWNVSRLSELLDHAVVPHVLGVLPPSFDAARDRVAWRLTPTGAFTVASAYEGFLSPSWDVCDPKWSSIWSLPVAQRVRMFLWLVLRQRLMTNVERVRRGLSSDPSCSSCGCYSETILHILRDCPPVRSFWKSIIP
ncbi:hypothetical protein V6N12_069185 [Hibiscus sabdariffa]|uniref:Reverse transcriptase zinc-binding domain-containing protein n=1 Tax=Hibiscus sabdariffa TaxID=183260 RepID=A0ABR2FDH9_9ROSI